MKHFDHLVVGSGASGLTATLLLALQGRKVLLLEKAPHLGGSLARFRRGGLPFDTGFHFTGGLTEHGLLSRMLRALGLAEEVEPQFMAAEKAHRFVFESVGRTIDLPCGLSAMRQKLKADFPGEQVAVERYFDLVEKVCAQTGTMDLSRLTEPSARLDEEYISLKDVLDGLTGDVLLKGVLSGLSMCYGVKPSEMSFASHSRVCYDLYESTARFKAGGETLIEAFQRHFQGLGVETACSCWVEKFDDIQNDQAGKALLNTGEEVAFGSALLTIHPRQILQLLPREQISKAFVERVMAFEPSLGFFTLFGTLDGGPHDDTVSSIISLFPLTDFETLLDPAYRGEQALVIVGNEETVGGARRRTATILEPAFPQAMEQWQDTLTGRRPPAYRAYKQERVEAILKHLVRYDARYGAHFQPTDSASVLTYRDYLHSFDGSAYGIKQKLGQYNLIGRLPVRNLFAAGQSALLPGVAGAMMSSFIVVRSMVGRDAFNRFMGTRLCN